MNSSYQSLSNSTSSFDLESGTQTFLSFFESYLSDLLDNLEQPVRDLAKHVCLSGGKRIRPFLVYTCGVGKASTEDLLKASAVIELIHVATLVHDDILDSADLRRGNVTLHSKFGEYPSILLGDALFSFALELATDFPCTKICKIVSTATRKTCAGEIQQTFSKNDFLLSSEDYFSIIQDKTGELFNASCSIGSFLSGADETLIDIVGDFGTSLGLNYQIYDDLVDAFGNHDTFGKSLGSDFESGKVTLPLIILMESVTSKERELLNTTLGINKHDFEFRNYLAELFKLHNIQESCIIELQNRFNQSKLIASNIPDNALSLRLLKFIESFDFKIGKLISKSDPNFLALT
jgi:octaprenyl-diphosphate synthase